MYLKIIVVGNEISDPSSIPNKAVCISLFTNVRIWGITDTL